MPSDKVTPESLELRPPLPRGARINRRLVGAVLAAVALAALSALFYGFYTARPEPGAAPSNPAFTVAPTGLKALPERYGDIPPPAPVPRLGPPLPGEVGALKAKAGRPDEARERLRAEAEKARTSEVFFDIAARSAPSTEMPPTAKAPAAAGKPEEVLPAKARQSHSQGEPHRVLEPASTDAESVLQHSLQAPPSRDAVMAGTIIPAVLLTGINSDLPGPIVAQVRENVYDTATGADLLIPQGARLVGVYDAAVAFGQERVLIAWNRLIFPDSSSLVLGHMTGADLAGLSGLKDKVNNHWPQLIGAVILSSLLSTGTIASQGDIEGFRPDLAQELARAVGDNINRAGQKIIQRQLNVQPTLEIRPGWSFNVMVNKDLILRPYKE